MSPLVRINDVGRPVAAHHGVHHVSDCTQVASVHTCESDDSVWSIVDATSVRRGCQRQCATVWAAEQQLPGALRGDVLRWPSGFQVVVVSTDGTHRHSRAKSRCPRRRHGYLGLYVWCGHRSVQRCEGTVGSTAQVAMGLIKDTPKHLLARLGTSNIL